MNSLLYKMMAKYMKQKVNKRIRSVWNTPNANTDNKSNFSCDEEFFTENEKV